MTAPLLFLRTLGIFRGDDLAALVLDLEGYLHAFRAEAKA